MAYKEGDKIVLLNSNSFSGSSAVEFKGLVTSKFSTYMFAHRNISVSTDNAKIYCQVSTNNGVSYININYVSTSKDYVYNSATTFNADESSQFLINDSISNAGNGANGNTYFYNVTNGGSLFMNGQTSYDQAIGIFSITGGTVPDTNINAFKFFPSAGTFSGKIIMYGVIT